MRRPLLPALLGVAVMCAITTTSAHASSSRPASDPTDHPTAEAPNSNRSEPALAVSPLDARIVVAAANDTEHGDVTVTVSRNGGRTFGERTHLPLLAAKASDPALDFDAQGRLYASYVSVSLNPDGSLATNIGGLTVTRSFDQGRTWSAPVLVAPSSGKLGHCFVDFPSLAVDRSRGTIYAAWQAPDAPCDANSFHNPLYVSHSDDHGRSWSSPVPLPAVPGFTISPVIHAAAGLATVAFTSFDPNLAPRLAACQPSGPLNYHVAVSRDGGRSFTQTLVRKSVCGPTRLGQTDPILQASLSTATGATFRYPAEGDVAWDAAHRLLMLVTPEADATNVFGRIHVSVSSDQGRSWRSAGTVPAAVSEQQLFPRLSINAQGRAVLLWIAQAPGGSFQATASVSPDSGRTWSAETPVATAPSMFRNVGYLGYVGDYLANVVGPDGRAYLGWTDTRSQNTAGIGIPPLRTWSRAI